jgi:hypothetical protein
MIYHAVRGFFVRPSAATRHTSGGYAFCGGAVQEHELYKKYRQLIEELANRPELRNRWLADRHTLLQRFATEATMDEEESAYLLCEELADQFKQEVLRVTTTHRRNLLLGAVKGFDALSLPLAQR